MKDDLFAELEASVRQGGRVLREREPAARTFELPEADVAAIRETYGLSQAKFASLMGISVRTLQNWEQGRRTPRGPARVLLRIAAAHPDAVLDVVRPRRKRKVAAKRQAAKKERERQARMKKMVDDPQAWLRKSSELVDARGTANYKAAAEILADLREAIGGESGEEITRKLAANLTKEHPTLTHLKSQFRKRGLLE